MDQFSLGGFHFQTTLIHAFPENALAEKTLTEYVRCGDDFVLRGSFIG